MNYPLLAKFIVYGIHLMGLQAILIVLIANFLLKCTITEVLYVLKHCIFDISEINFIYFPGNLGQR